MLQIRQIFQNKFILSSGIVLVGSTAANFINYFYNLVLGRILDPVSYGEVAAYVTLAMIIVVPSGTLATLVTKSVSEYNSKGHHHKVRSIYSSSIAWALAAGFLLLAIFLAINPWLTSYLKTSAVPAIVFAFFLPLTLIASTSKGMLQGLHQFLPTTLIMVIESAGKLIFAVLFVYLGWGVSGAIGGMLVGTVLSYIYSLLVLRKKIPAAESTLAVDGKESIFSGIPKYVYLIFFTTLCLSVFGNVDVVLAKHYLADHAAGQYAALAVLGRIVTYSSIAIITVLLPMAAASDQKNSNRLLNLSLGLTLVVSAVVITFFYMVPDFAVKLLFGADYLEIAPYLGIFGLTMLLGSLSKIFVSYFMARHQSNFIYPFAVLTLAQIILIMWFHSSIDQIVKNLLITNIGLFISMVIIHLYNPKSKVMDPEPAEVSVNV